ncbi:HPF/RaiA family ribosome-associated protein [Nitrospira sp. M1]
MDIKIESRNVGMTPRWKTEIETRVAALETDSIHITHARVTLTKNAHHKKGADNAEALVLLTIPRRHTVTARKEAKTFEEAIRHAFQAVETEIKKMHEKRVSKDTVKADPAVLEIASEEVPDENIAQASNN